jgi:phage-related minor tail protein
MALPKQEFIISAKDQTKQAFDSIAGSLNNIQKGALSLSKSFGFLAPIASVGAFAAFTKSGIDALDMLGDLSERTGVAATTLAGFQLVAKQSDTSLESLGMGLNKLSLFMANNAAESKKLGLTAADPAEAFIQLAATLENTTSVQERNQIASKALGKSYTELLPTLNQGADALRRQIEEGKGLSSATEESVKQAQAFNDEYDKLTLISGQLGVSLAVKLLPSFIDISNAMKTAANEAGVLQSIFVGLGGLGDLIFNGTKIKQAADAVADLEKEIVKLEARKVELDKGDPILEAIYGKAQNQTRLDKAKAEIVAAQKVLADLTAAPAAKETVKDTVAGFSYDDLTKGLTLTSDKLEKLRSKQVETDAAFKAGYISLEKYNEITAELNNQINQANKGSKTETQKTAEAAAKAAQAFTDKLVEQAATLGLTDEAILNYELSQQKLTEAQLAAAQSSIAQIAAFKQNQQAIKDATDDEKIFKSGDDREIEALEEQSRIESETLAAREADYQTFYDNLVATNDQLNIDLISSDTKRAQAQLDLENQRTIDRINNLGLENDELQQLLDQQAEIYAKGTKKIATQGGSDFDELRRSIEGTFDKAAQKITDFALKGEGDISDLIDQIISDFARLALQRKVLDPILDGFESFLDEVDFGSFFANANGGVYKGAGINKYSNTVVDKPTLFPFARGTGLMGEAGPEAILPLTRVNGKLGVQSVGGQGGDITVNIIGAPGTPQVKQTPDQNGGMTIDVIFEQVESFMAKRVSKGDGNLASVIEGRYGLSPSYGAAG